MAAAPYSARVCESLLARVVIVAQPKTAGISLTPRPRSIARRIPSTRVSPRTSAPDFMTVQTVTVLGAGTMGHGIAHAAATAGYQTQLFDVSETQLENARSLIDGIFLKSV